MYIDILFISLLLKNIKEVCERYEVMSEELHMSRQYLLETKNDRKPYTSSFTPLKRSIHTWGSQGSIMYDSPSPVFDHGEYDEYNAAYVVSIFFYSY